MAKGCGIDLQIISGQEEARLIRLGVLGSDCPDRTLCIDVGGGSTELVIASGVEGLYLDSLGLGAIRISFGTGIDQSGKVSSKQCGMLKSIVAERCRNAVSRMKRIGFDNAIGSSGTMEALAEACAVRRGDTNDTCFGYDELRQLMKHLCELDPHERRRTLKISANRADILIGGGVIVETLMELLDLSCVRVSRNGLREGMMAEYCIRRGQDDPGVRVSSARALAARCNCITSHEYAVTRYCDMRMMVFHVWG